MNQTTIPLPARGLGFTESSVLVGRSIKHIYRSVDSLIMSIALPVMILVMFVYVFGGAIDQGGRYIDYVVPGIILLTAGFGSAMTATTVASDMTEGFIDRVRTMPIRTWAAVGGHVIASVLRNLMVTALVIGVAFLMGFRPVAGPLEWLGVVGVITLFVLAITWIAVILGLIAKSVEAAGNFTFFVTFLPYLSSAFVDPVTMPTVLRAIAENQPITPIIETARGLLLGMPIGDYGWLAVGWCVALLAIAIPLSARLYRRRTAS